ncbi:MAG: dihydroorotase [Candidatus Gracilibacteria bacterium]
MTDLVLKKGKIVFIDGVREGDVVIHKGEIIEITPEYKEDVSKVKVIDCQGKFIFPGVIDAHVHMRTPGALYKEDFATGSMAAISAGVTSFLDMPNNVPPVITKNLLAEKRDMVSGQSFANYGLFFGATDDNVDELKRITNIPGVKVYMGETTGNLIVRKDETLEQIFSYSHDRFPIVVHAESQECLDRFSAEYAGSDARSREDFHSVVRPPECAREAVKHVLHLAKKFDARVHVAHASSAEEIEVIRKFKSENVTCEVTPHHLVFDTSSYAKLGSRAKVNPPLRTKEDVDALWDAIKDGTIDIVASDHAPHLLNEKDLPYEQCPAGFPGIETILPVMLDAANRGLLNLDRVAQLLSSTPARIFGIKNKGRIEVGYDADIVIVDMDLEKEVTNGAMLTKCAWTPWDGMKLKGWPITTIVGGEIIYDGGKFVSSTRGKELNFGE